MPFTKTISFIIPVFNEEQNIAAVLRDLFQVVNAQKEWNSELIVVEDGSTDNTRRVLLKELEKYPKVQLVLHDQNQGYTQSLKDGIATAQGRFLMYVGADEEFDC